MDIKNCLRWTCDLIVAESKSNGACLNIEHCLNIKWLEKAKCLIIKQSALMLWEACRLRTAEFLNFLISSTTGTC